MLIVEDDPDVARAARVALLPHVGRVDAATAPAEIEQLLASADIDAVLLDMNFVSGVRSGQAGLDALGQVRQLDPSLAVVLMTAFGGVALAVESLKGGAVDFILKPWRNEKLVEAVIGAMKITRARREGELASLDALERGAIERALARHNGNVSLAASDLGLSRPALYRRISKHGL